MKVPALRCSSCGTPIRKGQSVVITMFARHTGVQDGQHVTDPYLSVIVHQREGCMGTLTVEVVREARKAALTPHTKREETD